MNYKDRILKDLEYDLNETLNKKDLFKDNIITSKYVEYLGFQYISTLDNYDVITSNLSLKEKNICIENGFVLLKNKKTKHKCLGVNDLNANIDSLNQIDFEELIIIENNLYNQIFNNILVSSNSEYSKKNLKFYKNKLFIYTIPSKNCKAFDLFPSYYKEKVVLLYISDFMSYLYAEGNIKDINIRENNFVEDMYKIINIIKYIFNKEEKLVVVNNSSSMQVKELLSTIEFKFKLTYISKENFQIIYDKLPG